MSAVQSALRGAPHFKLWSSSQVNSPHDIEDALILQHKRTRSIMSYLTTVSQAAASTSVASSSRSSLPADPTRLFIGNLSPTVDEYTLIQVFSKAGKIAKLDYLFHKTGPLRGKPRGYAFVEYTNKEDAQKALTKLNGRLLRGRNLSVTQATASPMYDQGTRPFRRPNDPPKTTTLSLLKKQTRPQSANAQIAALEQKIAQMRDSPLSISAPGSRDASPGIGRVLGEGPTALPDTKGNNVDREFEQGFNELMAEVETGTEDIGSSRHTSRPSDCDQKATNSEFRPLPKSTSALVGHPSLPQKPSSGTIERAKDLERLRK